MEPRGTVSVVLSAYCLLLYVSYRIFTYRVDIFDYFRFAYPSSTGKACGRYAFGFCADCGRCFLLSLPLFFFTNRRWVVFIPLFLFDVFCLIQTLYARVYEDIMPYSSFLLVNNVNDVLLNSVRGLIRLRDIFVFFPTLLLLAGYIFYFRKQRHYPSSRTRAVVDSFVFLCGQSSSYLSSCAFRSRVSVDGFHYAL